MKKLSKSLNPILQSNYGFWPLVFVCITLGIVLGKVFAVAIPSFLFLILAFVCYYYAATLPSFCYWLLLFFTATMLGANYQTIPLEIKKEYSLYVEEIKIDANLIYKAVVLSEFGRFRLSSDIPLYPGEILKVRTNAREVNPAKNPGEFCYATYLKNQGISGTMTLNSDWQIIARKKSLKSRFWELLYKIREKGKERLLDLEQGELYSALLLGTPLDEEIAEIAREAGTSHFLVVSGLHVGYMAILATKIPFLGPYFTIILLFFYACLVGSTPSVWRAVFSYLLAKRYASRMIDRLALTLTILLVLNPKWLFSPSFQYSALATLGIALLEPWDFWAPLKVGLGAFMMVPPYSLWQNKRMNFLSLVGNLFLGPLVGIMMGLSLVYLVCPLSYLGVALDFLGSLFMLTNNYLSRFSFFVSGFNWLQAVIFWALWLYLWHEERILPNKRLFLKRVVVVILVLLVFLFSYYTMESVRPVELYFLQILDGDASILRLPYGDSIMIDTGSKTDTYSGAKNILNPALLYLGIKNVDTVYLSHRHQDHTGGLDEMLYCDKIKVGYEIWPLRDSLFKKYNIQLAEDERYPFGVQVRIIDMGKEYGDPNDNSLVQLVEVLGWRVLFTGDREKEGLENLPTIPVDIVKVPHHGAPNSFVEDWVKGTKASLAVFMGGKSGRPHLDVVEGWQKYAGKVCVTKDEGAVRIRFYPKKIEIATWQNGRFKTKYVIKRELGGVREIRWLKKLKKLSFFF